MELKLMTLNMWQLPRPFSAHRTIRLRRLKKFVRKADPDIIALQEMWPWTSVWGLRRLGYYMTADVGLYNTSGLLTLSKFKPKEVIRYKFKKTSHHNLIEWLAFKGLQKIRFRINGEDVWVLNTHLYNPMQEWEKRIVGHQFRILKGFAGSDTVLLGDLNLDWADFLSLNEDYFIHDGNGMVTTTRQNKYQNMRFNRLMDSEFKDDYVLFRPGKFTASWNTKIIKEPLMSDHYPIMTRMKLKKIEMPGGIVTENNL
ncbi:endonuclease/exonuclease/phosphatase family protein [Nanoarchaeota archaeon]